MLNRVLYEFKCKHMKLKIVAEGDLLTTVPVRVRRSQWCKTKLSLHGDGVAGVICSINIENRTFWFPKYPDNTLFDEQNQAHRSLLDFCKKHIPFPCKLYKLYKTGDDFNVIVMPVKQVSTVKKE